MKFLRILQKRRQHIKDALRKEMHTCKLEAQNIMRFGRHQILPSFWYLLVAAPVLLFYSRPSVGYPAILNTGELRFS